MAEAHPVGFRWAMKARERRATVMHVDPRFSRTSAMADLHVPIRAGSDIAFLGGLIRHVLETESYFKEYVLHYTNAATLVREDFKDTEELDGVFTYICVTDDALGMAKDELAAKPLVLYESDELVALADACHARGEQVAGYGISVGTTTLLPQFGLEGKIDFLVDGVAIGCKQAEPQAAVQLLRAMCGICAVFA